MILGPDTIKYIIKPYHERSKSHGLSFGMGPATYDVRIDQDLGLAPGQFSLASTLEYFTMPNWVCAQVMDKSTWARRGVSLFNTFIDPGWKGFLTLEIINNGHEFWGIERGTPIAQVLFHQMAEHSKHPYNGKYMEQPPRPVEAITE